MVDSYTFSWYSFSVNSYLPLISIVLGACVVGLSFWIATLHRRISALTRGKDARSLESEIKEMLTVYGNALKHLEGQESRLTILESRIEHSASQVTCKRFDAFESEGAGGKQSFCIKVLSDAGDGVLITSLASRNGTSLYAKKIEKFKSETPLLSEESELIGTNK